MNRKTEAELMKADDIAMARAQARRLTARIENEFIPEIARAHDVVINAIADGEEVELISMRYTDVEFTEALRSRLAKRLK